jgi:hypothetical protein
MKQPIPLQSTRASVHHLTAVSVASISTSTLSNTNPRVEEVLSGYLPLDMKNNYNSHTIHPLDLTKSTSDPLRSLTVTSDVGEASQCCYDHIAICHHLLDELILFVNGHMMDVIAFVAVLTDITSLATSVAGLQ